MKKINDNIILESYKNLEEIKEKKIINENNLKIFDKKMNFNEILSWILEDFNNEELIKIIVKKYIHNIEIQSINNIFWLEQENCFVFIYGDYSL